MFLLPLSPILQLNILKNRAYTLEMTKLYPQTLSLQVVDHITNGTMHVSETVSETVHQGTFDIT